MASAGRSSTNKPSGGRERAVQCVQAHTHTLTLNPEPYLQDQGSFNNKHDIILMSHCMPALGTQTPGPLLPLRVMQSTNSSSNVLPPH